MTPGEIQFDLSRRLLSLGRGGAAPVIVDVHSTLIEGGIAFINYDVRIGAVEEILPYEFPLPVEVAPHDIRDFAIWLACAGRGETLH